MNDELVMCVIHLLFSMFSNTYTDEALKCETCPYYVDKNIYKKPLLIISDTGHIGIAYYAYTKNIKKKKTNI